MTLQEKLSKIQIELKVAKTKTNKFGGYKFRSAEDILESLKPMNDKYGVYFLIREDLIGEAVIKSEATIFDLEGNSIEEILGNLDMSNGAVRNNGGGFYNHSLFWSVMNPNNPGELSGDLKDAIMAEFGSFEAFKDAFSKAAATQFGSGWAWLCVLPGGKVEVCSTPNQDNPLMPGVTCGGTPILGIDVWEHAYYLNYQNRRPDYIEAFFNVINWNEVASRYAANK